MAPMGGGAGLLCSTWEKEEREGEGKEKRKGEKEKKGKGKRKRRERGVGAIRGGSRPRALCDVWSDSDARRTRRRGRWNSDWYRCRDGGLPEDDFGRLGARTGKDF